MIGCPVILNLLGAVLWPTFDVRMQVAYSLVLPGNILLCCLASVSFSSKLKISIGKGQRQVIFVVAFYWLYWLFLHFTRPSSDVRLAKDYAYGVFWVIMPGIFIIINSSNLKISKLINYIYILLSVYIFIIIIHFFVGNGYYHSGRYHPGANLGAIMAGRYAALATFVSLVFLLFGRKRNMKKTILHLVIFVSSLYTLSLINARGPTLGFVVAFCLLSPFLLKQINEIFAKNKSLSVATFLLFSLLLVGVLYKLGQSESNFSRLVSVSNDGGSAMSRLTQWSTYLSLFGENPLFIIFGAGYSHNMFYPHSIYVETLVCGGVFHFLLMLIFMGYIFNKFYRTSKFVNRNTIMLFGCFIIGLMGSAVSGSIGSEPLMWLFGLLLVIYRPENFNKGNTSLRKEL
jgi:hypothetical protein